MQKLFEKSHTVPLPIIKSGMRKRISQLESKYGELRSEYGVQCTWNTKKRTLFLQSSKFKVDVIIAFTESKYACFAEIPFHIYIMSPSTLEALIKIVSKEIQQYLREIKKISISKK